MSEPISPSRRAFLQSSSALVGSAALPGMALACAAPPSSGLYIAIPDGPLHIVPHSSLNLSEFRSTDALAGAGGFGPIIRAVDDPTQLRRRDLANHITIFAATWAGTGPGRFTGLPNDANVADAKSKIRKAMQDLAHRGFNALRIHGLEYYLMQDRPGAFDFPADRLDRWDYMMAQAKEAGLYWILNPRQPQLYQAFTGATFNGSQARFDPWGTDYKPAIYVDQSVRNHWLQGFELLYNRVNPYTGVNILQDPALFTIEPFNECGTAYLARASWPAAWRAGSGSAAQTWPQWLASRYGDIAGLKTAWQDTGNNTYATFETAPCPTTGLHNTVPTTPVQSAAMYRDAIRYALYLDNHLSAYFKTALSGITSALISSHDHMNYPGAAREYKRDTQFDIVNTHGYPRGLPATFQNGSSSGHADFNRPIWEQESFLYSFFWMQSGKPLYLGEHSWPHWGFYRNQYPMLVAYLKYHKGAGASFFHQGNFFASQYDCSQLTRTKDLFLYEGHTDPVARFIEMASVFAMRYVTPAAQQFKVKFNDGYLGLAPDNSSLPARLTRSYSPIGAPLMHVAAITGATLDWEDQGNENNSELNEWWKATTAFDTATDYTWRGALKKLVASGHITAQHPSYVSTVTQNSGDILAAHVEGTHDGLTADAQNPVIEIGTAHGMKTGDKIMIPYLKRGTLGPMAEVRLNSYKVTVSTNKNAVQVLGLNLTTWAADWADAGAVSGIWCEGAGNLSISADEQLHLSRRKKYTAVDNPQYVFFGSAGIGSLLDLPKSHVKVHSADDGAAFFLASLDGLPLDQSWLVLIGIVGDSQNTGEAFGNERLTVTNVGTAPILQKIVTADITLPLNAAAGSAHYYIEDLDRTGNTTLYTPVAATSGTGLRLTLSTAGNQNYRAIRRYNP